MKWIAILLMIANVATYVSIGGKGVSNELPPLVGNPDVNKEGMLLLTEIVAREAAGITRQQTGDPALPEVGSSNIPDSSSGNDGSSNGTAPVSAEAGGRLPCYRVGPFKAAGVLQSATDWLHTQKWPFRQTSTQGRELKSVRVYLGPFNDRAATTKTVNRLKTLDLNSFVYPLDQGGFNISLGYFTQQALARKYVDYLKSIGVEAQSRTEYRQLGPYHWVEVSMDAQNRQLLQSQSWTEGGITVSETGCG